MIKKFEHSFAINTIGEDTNETFAGKFTCRTRLTHGERLTQDSIRRALLGTQPAGVTIGERAANTAEILASLQIRIVDSPSWWTNSNGGVDLVDDNLIIELYTTVMKAEADAKAELKKAADEAKGELKKETPAE